MHQTASGSCQVWSACFPVAASSVSRPLSIPPFQPSHNYPSLVSVTPTICVCYMSKWGLSFNWDSSFSFFLSSSPAWERVIYLPGRSSPLTVFPMCSCFILGSSADTQQPPGYWTGGEPLHVSQGAWLSAPLFSGPSVPSLLIILLLLETISLHLSTRKDVLIHPADVDR